jgi:hypothetical protein
LSGIAPSIVLLLSLSPQTISMIHPDTELRLVNPQIGYGVFATRFIPRGTITWVRDRLDQALTPAAIAQLPTVYHDIVLKYSFIDGAGRFVLCWDHARFVNHSCNPTCRSAGYDFELAVRDIAPGEELTDDYGSLNLEYDFTCSCGLPECRRQVRPGDLLAFADDWDRIVAEPFLRIPTLTQPLWHFLEEKGAVEAALSGASPIASVRANYVNIGEILCGFPLAR